MILSYNYIQKNHLLYSIEPMQINAVQKIRVRASEILTKFRHSKDRYNFCSEKSKNIINNLKVFIFRMKIISTQLFFTVPLRNKKSKYIIIICIVVSVRSARRL